MAFQEVDRTEDLSDEQYIELIGTLTMQSFIAGISGKEPAHRDFNSRRVSGLASSLGTRFRKDIKTLGPLAEENPWLRAQVSVLASL